MDTKTRVGENVRRIRKMRGLGQVALSKRSGVSQQSISGIERGYRETFSSTLEKLADALNVPVAALYQEEEAPKAPHTAMPPEEFDELRREANSGRINGSALLKATQGEYDLLDAYYRLLLDRGGDAPEIEEALELLKEARRRWRVVLFDRAEQTIALDERRDPMKPERPDNRFLSLDEADERIRSVARTPA